MSIFADAIEDAKIPQPPLVRGFLFCYLPLTVAALVQGSFVVRDFSGLIPGAGLLQGIYGWWWALTWMLACHRIGVWLGKIPWLGEFGLEGLPAWFFRGAVGVWFFSCLLLGLSIGGLLQGPGSWAAGFLIVLAGGWEVIRLLRLALRFRWAPPLSRPDQDPTWMTYLLGCGVLLWFLPFLLQSFLPNTDGDGAMYHLPLARRFLNPGAGSVDPYFYYFNLPGIPHLFYGVLIQVGADSGIIPLSMLASLGVLFAVYACARSLEGPRSGLWAFGILLTVNLLWEVGLTPRIDAFLTLFFFLGCYALFLWWKEPDQRGLLPISGLLFGLAAGTKYTTVPLLAGPGLVILLGLLFSSSARRSAPGALVGAVLLFPVPSGFWYVRNALELADPVYFFGRHRLVFEDAQGNLGSFDELLKHAHAHLPGDSQVQESLAKFNLEGILDPRKSVVRPSLWMVPDLIFQPDLFETKPLHWVGPWIFLGLLLPLVSAPSTGWFLWLAALVDYVVLGSITHWVRYLLPIVPLLACGAGMVVRRFEKFAGPAHLAVTLPVAVLLTANVGYLVFQEAVKLQKMHPWHFLAGGEIDYRLLNRVGYNGNRTVFPAIDYLNDQFLKGRVKAEDVVLMIGESRGEFLLCRYFPDAAAVGFRWLTEALQMEGDSDRLTRRLRSQKVEFLLVNSPQIQKDYREGNVLNPARTGQALALLSRFVGDQADLVFQNQGVALYRLKGKR